MLLVEIPPEERASQQPMCREQSNGSHAQALAGIRTGE